jgi:hypothetical protein
VTLILLDDRTEFLAEYDERYALGPPESPLLTLNAADGYGCAWIATLDGWEAPEVTTPMDRRPDGHGGFVGASSYDPRSLTLDGTVTAPDRPTLAAARRRLLGAVLGDLTGFVRFTHLDDDPAPRGLWVRPVGQPKWDAFSDRAADFACVLLAEDPIRTGASRTYGPVRVPSTAGEGGYALPLTMPATSAAPAPTTTVAIVANDGDEPAHATYRFAGPISQPIAQVSTGEFVFLRLDLGASDVATVDTASGVVDVNGVIRYDAWGPGSTFPLIPGRRLLPDGTETPGGAEVRLRSYTGGPHPAAALYVDSAPSWR